MKRFNTTTNGYRYDKLIFYGILFIYFLSVFFIAYKSNFDFSNKVYFECTGVEPCDNPFYFRESDFGFKCNRAWLYGNDCNIKNETWFNLEKLPPGRYGEKEPKYYNYAILFLVLFFILGLILNHFYHNKGKGIEVEIKISKNKIVILNKETIKRLSEVEENG